MTSSVRALKIIRDFFPLDRLLDPEQLEAYSMPHELKPHQFKLAKSGLVAGRLSFLDDCFRAIPLPTQALELCGEISSALVGYDTCAACSLLSNAPLDDSAVFSECGAGCVLRCT